MRKIRALRAAFSAAINTVRAENALAKGEYADAMAFAERAFDALDEPMPSLKATVELNLLAGLAALRTEQYELRFGA